MKTLEEINKEIESENKGKTAVDSLINYAQTLASYYELARLKCKSKDNYIILLENEIEKLKR